VSNQSGDDFLNFHDAKVIFVYHEFMVSVGPGV